MTAKSKCACLTFVNKVSVGSVNDGWTEYNVTTVKKVSKMNGDQLPYISGQALRRMIRDRLLDLGYPVSPLREVPGTENYATECDPRKYVDDDLFGYMDPKEKSRTGAVRFSAAVGLFPFRHDKDLGTRNIAPLTKDKTSGGNIYESEIYYNYFRATVLIELDRVGVFGPGELGKGHEGDVLPETERGNRMRAFCQAVYHLWGGGKQSRLATDVGPAFVLYTRQSYKRPHFLETVTMDDDESIRIAPILEVLQAPREQTGIQERRIGIRSGIFTNEEAIRRDLRATTLEDAFRDIEEDLVAQFR